MLIFTEPTVHSPAPASRSGAGVTTYHYNFSNATKALCTKRKALLCKMEQKNAKKKKKNHTVPGLNVGLNGMQIQICTHASQRCGAAASLRSTFSNGAALFTLGIEN